MPELDSTGKQVGERAIGVKMVEDDEYRVTIAVFGPDYCAVISSSSLRYLFAYREVTGF